jgi:hypothetical protein
LVGIDARTRHLVQVAPDCALAGTAVEEVGHAADAAGGTFVRQVGERQQPILPAPRCRRLERLGAEQD